MNIVLKNPYRTVGLLVGASASEKRLQVNRLHRFLKGDQNPMEDFSFPILGNLPRSLETVSDAASKLDLNIDKMNAALFWFYKGNPISDELAFDAIKDGHLDEVLNIWTILTTTDEVNRLNASAYNNLSTLYLCGIFTRTNTNKILLEKGITLKLKFLESEFRKDLKALATDETFKPTKKELQLMFLNQLQSELEKSEIISSDKLLDIIFNQEFSAKEDFLKGNVQKLIEKIEKKIEETKKKLKGNKANAGDYGNKLIDFTNTYLRQLKSISGTTDINVKRISDKLANGILQCSITLFNHFHNTETEVSEISLELNKRALSIALGSVVIDRINESTSMVDMYINARPTRLKLKIIKDDLTYITEELDKFQLNDKTVSNAIKFANACKVRLANIKLKLGSSDEIYSTISTAVISNTQGMIVAAVNEATEKRNNYVKYYNFQNDPFCRFSVFWGLNSNIGCEVPYAPEYSLEKLKIVISEAWTAIVALGSFDMSGEQREYYNKNKTTLRELYKQFNGGFLFFRDTPMQKWIFRVVGFGYFISMFWT